jgi:hypothetical protein
MILLFQEIYSGGFPEFIEIHLFPSHMLGIY